MKAPTLQSLALIQQFASDTHAAQSARKEAEARTAEAESASRQALSALTVLKECNITAAIAHDDASHAHEKAGNTRRARQHKLLGQAHRDCYTTLEITDREEENEEKAAA